METRGSPYHLAYLFQLEQRHRMFLPEPQMLQPQQPLIPTHVPPISIANASSFPPSSPFRETGRLPHSPARRTHSPCRHSSSHEQTRTAQQTPTLFTDRKGVNPAYDLPGLIGLAKTFVHGASIAIMIGICCSLNRVSHSIRGLLDHIDGHAGRDHGNCGICRMCELRFMAEFRSFPADTGDSQSIK